MELYRLGNGWEVNYCRPPRKNELPPGDSGEGIGERDDFARPRRWEAPFIAGKDRAGPGRTFRAVYNSRSADREISPATAALERIVGVWTRGRRRDTSSELCDAVVPRAFERNFSLLYAAAGSVPKRTMALGGVRV